MSRRKLSHMQIWEKNMNTVKKHVEDNLQVLANRWKTYNKTEITGAKSFMQEFLECFDLRYEPNELPFESKTKDKTIMDCYIENTCIIEVKNPYLFGTKEKLLKAKDQIVKYWLSIGKSTPYLILSNFKMFIIIDTRDDTQTCFKITEAPSKIDSFNFLLDKCPTFIPEQEAITKEAASKLGELYHSLVGQEPNRVKDVEIFILQCLFCLFAEKIGYLESLVFTKCIEKIENKEESSANILGNLFRRLDDDNPDSRTLLGIKLSYFNGSLFSNKPEFILKDQDVKILKNLTTYKWEGIKPEIFGTIFQTIASPEERRNNGEHYTYENDIMKVVKPCIIDDWEERISECKSAKDFKELHKKLLKYRVLDPACGSGNFLIVAYRELKKIESRILKAYAHHSNTKIEKVYKDTKLYSLNNMYGLEIKAFPAFLSKVSLWVAQKQMAIELGNFENTLPLETLKHIQGDTDALFVTWDDVDVVIGNPPFTGAKRIRGVHGDLYIQKLKKHFVGHNQMADYCSYWYRKAINELREGAYIGLVSTNTIKDNNTKKSSLDYIYQTQGEIFNAYDNLKWSGEAKVYVSIVNFINKKKYTRDTKFINGEKVNTISSRLLPFSFDWKAKTLKENSCFAYVGAFTRGNFFVGIEDSLEKECTINYLSGRDIVQQKKYVAATRTVIDFEDKKLEKVKKQYPKALKIIEKKVKPVRMGLKGSTIDNKKHKQLWWQHGRIRSGMRKNVLIKERFLVTSRVSKYPIFVMLDNSDKNILPSDSTVAIGWDDWSHYCILNSSFHTIWYHYHCSSLGQTPTYTNSIIFEPFPFPYDDSNKLEKLGEKLDKLRKDLVYRDDISLTTLYNIMNEGGYQELAKLHKEIDIEVAKIYGFKGDLSKKEEIIEFLLMENKERYENELKSAS